MNKRSALKYISAIVLMFALSFTVAMPEEAAAAATPSSIYTAVSGAYGKSYPLSDDNEINTARTNVFGKYSNILGVSAKLFTSYKAAKKSNSKYEYVSFVCEADGSANVNKIKKKLKKYVKNETSGNENYFSATGKKLMKNTKIGSKGNFVCLFILDTSGNSKAVKAFNKNA